MHNVYTYILVMAVVTYLIRLLPLTLIRKKIRSRFIQSFLYYVPYVTLSAMTFPGILDATHHWQSSLAGFVTALILAFRKHSLIQVALLASLAAFVAEYALLLLR